MIVFRRTGILGKLLMRKPLRLIALVALAFLFISQLAGADKPQSEPQREWGAKKLIIGGEEATLVGCYLESDDCYCLYSGEDGVVHRIIFEPKNGGCPSPVLGSDIKIQIAN